jgi:hypothetical protein
MEAQRAVIFDGQFVKVVDALGQFGTCMRIVGAADNVICVFVSTA